MQQTTSIIHTYTYVHVTGCFLCHSHILGICKGQRRARRWLPLSSSGGYYWSWTDKPEWQSTSLLTVYVWSRDLATSDFIYVSMHCLIKHSNIIVLQALTITSAYQKHHWMDILFWKSWQRMWTGMDCSRSPQIHEELQARGHNVLAIWCPPTLESPLKNFSEGRCWSLPYTT